MNIIPQNGMIVGELLGLYKPPEEAEKKIITPGSMEKTPDDVVGIRVTGVSQKPEYRTATTVDYEPIVKSGDEILTRAMFLVQIKNTNIVMIRQSEVLAVVEEQTIEEAITTQWEGEEDGSA